MKEKNIAKRYAGALAKVEVDNLAVVVEQIQQVGEILKKDPKIGAFFMSPKVKASAKKAVFKKVLGEKGFVPSVLFLVMILIDKGREKIFFHVIEEINEIFQEKSGNVSAYVTLPRKFAEGDAASVLTELSEKIKKNQQLFGFEKGAQINLIINQKVNPEILSGIVVTIGDYQWDASGRTLIQTWKKNVLKNKIDVAKIIAE